MDDVTGCCAPHCKAEAIGEYGIFLCERHALKMLGSIKRLARERGWNQRQVVTDRGRPQTSLAKRHADRHGYQSAEQVVYFIRFGDRVKIGTTRDPARRLTNLPHDAILGVIPGDLTTERAMHSRFAAHRIQGEWFRDCPEIKAFLAEVKAQAA